MGTAIDSTNLKKKRRTKRHRNNPKFKPKKEGEFPLFFKP
jgi:hypothetical protein